jgi:hypothetical protein
MTLARCQQCSGERHTGLATSKTQEYLVVPRHNIRTHTHTATYPNCRRYRRRHRHRRNSQPRGDDSHGRTAEAAAGHTADHRSVALVHAAAHATAVEDAVTAALARRRQWVSAAVAKDVNHDAVPTTNATRVHGLMQPAAPPLLVHGASCDTTAAGECVDTSAVWTAGAVEVHRAGGARRCRDQQDAGTVVSGPAW